MANPWTAFYWGDYGSKTDDLTATEHGVYFLLLKHYYSNGGPIEAIASRLLIVCRAFAEAERAAIDTILNRYFVREGDFWRHERCDEEIDKARQLSEKRSLAGKHGVEKKRSKHQANGTASGSANDKQLLTQPQPQSQPHKEKNRATQFPEGFQPKDSHKELALSLGINLRESFPAFRDFHQSKGNSFKNWDLALNTWLRNERKFSKSPPTNCPPPPNAMEKFRANVERLKEAN